MRGDKGTALVIGAGIAGMQSALLLAETGTKVFLLEQGPAIGGYFPLAGQDLSDELLWRLLHEPDPSCLLSDLRVSPS